MYLPAETLHLPEPTERAQALQAAVHLALTTDLEDLSGLGHLRNTADAGYTVLVDDDRGHFPSQTIEPADIRLQFDPDIRQRQLILVSKLLAPRALAQVARPVRRPQERPQPRRLVLSLRNFHFFQPVPTELSR